MRESLFTGNIAKHLEKNAHRLPNSIAVLFHSNPSSKKTFSQLYEDVINCASFFTKKGIKKRERTLVLVKPGYELIICCFGLLYIGAIPVIIDPGMGISSLLNCIKITKPKNIISIPLIVWSSYFFRTTFSSIKLRVTVKNNYSDKIRNYSKTDKPKIHEAKDTELAAIIFTSGSTGKPKGVRYLNLNFNAQIQVLQDEFGIKEGEIDLVTLPVFSLFNPALGVTSVIPKINPRKPASAKAEFLVKAILDHKTTTAFCSPVIGNKIATYCDTCSISLPSIKRIMLAGAPSSPDLVESLANRLPAGKVIIPYGATEALPVSYSDNAQIKSLYKSIISGEGSNLGRPIKNISILIMPIRNSPLPNEKEEVINPIKMEFELGEICVAGNTVTDGYDRMPGATRDARFIYKSKDYHRMGDLGYWDREGNLRFMGRKVECFQTEVGPVQTEKSEPLINNISGVERCALIGIGEEKTKEPCLVVVMVDRSLSKEITKEIRSHLSRVFPKHNIKRIFVESKLPVDARHNAKIHRLSLARKWSDKVSKNQNLGLD